MNNIGRIIYGFCNGYFGREDYRDKRIEAEGIDWIVCRVLNSDNESDEATFASFSSEEEKEKLIKKWSIKDE